MSSSTGAPTNFAHWHVQWDGSQHQVLVRFRAGARTHHERRELERQINLLTDGNPCRQVTSRDLRGGAVFSRSLSSQSTVSSNDETDSQQQVLARTVRACGPMILPRKTSMAIWRDDVACKQAVGCVGKVFRPRSQVCSNLWVRDPVPVVVRLHQHRIHAADGHAE